MTPSEIWTAYSAGNLSRKEVSKLLGYATYREFWEARAASGVTIPYTEEMLAEDLAWANEQAKR